MNKRHISTQATASLVKRIRFVQEPLSGAGVADALAQFHVVAHTVYQRLQSGPVGARRWLGQPTFHLWHQKKQ